MTLEELRIEADKLGYELVKKRDYTKRIKPCPKCGNTGNARYSLKNDVYTMTCPKCGFCVSVDAYHEDMYTVKHTTALKLMWNGDWDETRYTKQSLKKLAFSVEELLNGKLANIPKEPGLYTLIMPRNFEIRFLDKNIGKQFTSKGKRSEYAVDKLQNKVNTVYGSGISYRTNVIYIGQTSEKEGLQGRLRKYLGFRENMDWGNHDGGRAAWQIENSEDLIFVIEVIKDANPETIEKNASFHLGKCSGTIRW